MQEQTGNPDVEDAVGRLHPLLDVMSRFIGALKNHFLKKYGSNVNREKTLWVITVPAIWSERAKQFMREAAEKVSKIYNASDLSPFSIYINTSTCN